MKNNLHIKKNGLTRFFGQCLLIAALFVSGSQLFGQASLLSYSNNLSTVSGCDDCNVNVSITSVFPHGVQFGATTYTSVHVGSNGYITFGHGNSGYSPQGIQAYTSGPIIAAQYDDLDPRKGGNVYFDQNTGGNFVVATWHTVYPYNTPTGGGTGTNGVTFQIVLRKPSGYSSTNKSFQIEIRYNNIGWWRAAINSAWPTAGWSAGDLATYALLPYSGLSTFNQNQYNSNISQTGVWRWDVTGGVVQAAPTVNQTTAVTGITGSGGNSGGNVSSDGGSMVTERGIVYSTTNPPTTSHSKVTSGSGTGSFTASMSGLNPGTLYYVRAYAINSIGTGYGPTRSFTTDNISSPSVTTASISSVTTTTASSGGNVTATGGAPVSNRGVVWNTSGSPTISSYNGITSNGSGTGTYSSSLTGLSPNTTYYVRAYATNSAGTGYGSQLSFITQPTNPTSAAANPSTTCSGNATQLSVSNAQGTVYWYTGGCGTTFVGTGNPLTVYPTTTTTYYARNYNSSGFSSGCASVTVTVNQPASTPTSASGSPTGTTAADLSFGGSTGSGTITYYWVVGTSSSVTYGSGIAQGSTTATTAVAIGLSQSTTYFLRVYANNLCGNSSYFTSSSFRTHSVLTYLAGPNGSISGTTPQTVVNGGNGTSVTAVPDTEYNFVNWNDGLTDNPRTELNVTNSLTATANFAANRLSFLTQPVNTPAGQNIPVSVRITDTHGNTMTNSTAAVTIAIQTNPSIGGVGVLNGTLTVNAVDGVATFSDLWINKTGIGYTLIASAASPIVTQPVSGTFDIIPGALEYFTVAGILSPHMAGVTTTPVVTAFDEFDNLKYDYTGTIQFSTNNVSNNTLLPTLLPDDYTFIPNDFGIKAFINGVNLKESGIFYVKVNDGSKEGQQSGIEVTPAPINYFTLEANGPVIAGTPFTVTATVYDEFGNVKTNYDGSNDVLWTTTATSSPRGNPREIPANGPQEFAAGVATIGGFTFYNAQETPTITITDGPTSSPGTTDPIIVYNAPLDNFLVQPVPLESHNIGGVRRQAGEPFSVKVTARDVYFNIARDYVGNIRFKSSDDALVVFPSGLQPYVIGDMGIRTFTNAVQINDIGDYWLRAADALQAFKSGELKDIVIGPGAVDAAVSELEISYSSPVIAGDYVQVTVTPRDAFGNLLCTCQDVQILLQDSDEHRAGSENTWIPIPASSLINVGNGNYVTNVRVTEIGLNVFSAVVNTVTLNQTREVEVDPAPPSLAHTIITSVEESITTDENTLITVQLKDEFGNNRETNDGVVTLTTNLGGFGSNNGPGSVDAVYNGSGTYIATLYASYDAVSHGVGIATITGSIDFTDPSLTDGNIADNEVVNITEGLPSLVTSTIVADPTQITTDETSLITLQLKDHLGNLILNNRGTALLLSNVLGELSATSYDEDGRYIAILSGDVRPVQGVGIAYITGTFDGSGSAAGVSGYFNDGGSPSNHTTATVTISEGLPDVAMIQIDADLVTMTTDELSVITVTLYDHLGNLIIHSRGTVVLTTTLGAISAVTDNEDGTYTATLTGNATGTGTATISGTIVIDDIGVPVAIIDNAQVTITEGLPNLAQSTISAAPVSMTTDGESAITLQLKDQWGNSLTTSRGDVSMESTIGLLSVVTDNLNGTYTAFLTGDTRGVNGTGTSIITASFVGDATAAIVIGNFVNFTQVEITEGLPAIAMIDITADPTSMTTDESSTITVQLRDQFGNLIVTNRGPVVLSTDLGVIGATSYTTAGQYEAILTANNTGTGIATITGTIQIDGSGPILNIDDDAQVTITEGLPSLAQSSISAFPITMTTDESSIITLQLKDQWGNLLASSRGDVTMESTIGLLSSVTDNVDGTYTATLSGDTRGLNGTGLSVITGSFVGTGTALTVAGDFTDDTTVEITEGLPSGLTTTITANPVEMTIDQTSLISVQLKDWLGNLIVNDRAEVSLFTDLGVLTTVSYTTNGIYTATLSGNNQGIGLATITGSFVINGDMVPAEIINIVDDATVLINEGVPAIATTIITADPVEMTIDQTSLISVQLVDQFGNLIVNDRAVVALSTDRGILTGVNYVEDGIYTAILSGNSDGVGLATITGTFQIDGEGPALDIVDDATVNITEGLPNLLTSTITASPITMTTDESSVLTVQLKDQFGNLIVNNRGTVVLSTNLGVLTVTSYSGSGTYTATLTGNASGTGLATLTGTIIIDDEGSPQAFNDDAEVLITEGLPNLSQITITADPASITADGTSLITVQLKDQWGNNLTSSRGTIALSTSPIGALSIVTDNNNGTYSATFFLNAFGTGLATITGTLTGEITGAISDDATVNVTHGVATQLTIMTEPSPTAMAGVPFATQPQVRIEDQFGNLVTGDNTTEIAAARLLGTDNLYGTTTVTANAGIATFTDLYYTKMETITIVFSSDPILDNTNAVSQEIVVDHAPTAYYTINDVSFIIAGGQRAAYNVTRYDEFGNLVNKVVGDPDASERVYLYSNIGETFGTGTFYNALTGGLVITFVDIPNAGTTANFWLYSTVAGMQTITVSDNALAPDGDDGINDAFDLLEVRPAALKDFLVYGVENPHYYGDIQSVTVEARDLFDNLKTNYTGTITFSLTDVNASHPADYTYTLADAGIRTFPASILFSQPSSFSPALEWWVTAVDLAQPSKYGAQEAIIVLERPINIVAHDQTKNYYGDPYDLGTTLYTVTSGIDDPEAEIYANMEAITSVTLTSAGTDPAAFVGDYDIETSNATGISGFNPAYYNINYSSAGQLTVTPRPITIEVIPALQAKVFGELDPTFTYAVSSTLDLVNNDQFVGVLAREIGENVGFYGIDQGSLLIYDEGELVNKTNNYDITFVGGQFEITRRPIVVIPDPDQDKTYGDLDPVYAYTTSPDGIASVLPNGIAVALNGALTREPGEDVNTYKILQGNINNAENPNYDITFTEDDVLFTINRLPILVTANTGQTKIYGQLDPLPFTYTTNPVIGHTLANDLIVGIDGLLSRASGEDVGLYAIGQNTVTNATNPNYDVTFVSKDFEITRLAIALTPDAGQKKIYGEADPLPFAYTTAPTIGTVLDNGNVVALTGSLTREAGETVGLYNLLQGDVDNTENPNYSLTFVPEVKFEIERKDIVINVIFDQSKEYGDADPVYTYTTDPVEGALPFNASFIGALVREAGENVALDYTILQGTLELGDDNNANTSLAQNYNVTFNSADFEITLKTITITVDADQSKVYGEADPVFTFSSVPAIAALPFDAAWTGVLVRQTGEVVADDYTIMQGSLELTDANNLGGGSLAANYAVTFVEDDFEITRKAIIITVDPGIAKTYGDPDPAFTFSSNPAIGDLPFTAGWVGSLVRENVDENTGSYLITQGTLELSDANNDLNSLAQNYTVTFNTDDLDINQRLIAVTVIGGQSKVYADADPVFEYISSVDPLYFNGSFTGALARIAGENVADDYAISRGSLQIVDDNNTFSLDNNYNLTFIPAEFEITKKPITITVDAGQNKKYGFDDPVFTFQSSVDPLPFSGSFTGALVREAGTDVANDYAISRGTLQIVDNNHTTSMDHNYQLEFVGNDFEILTRPITILADDRAKTFGDPIVLGNTLFSIGGDGMAYLEEINTVDLISDGEPASANAGIYPIHTSNAVGSSGYNVSNYDITYSSDGELTVNTRMLTLSNFFALDRDYNGNTNVVAPAFTDNRLPGDLLAFTYDVAFDEPNVGLRNVNFTNIVIAGGVDKDNYHLDPNPGSGATTANIWQKALTITADDITKSYGFEYVFDNTEFTADGLVSGEGIVTVSLSSDGADLYAIEGTYDIDAENAVAEAGTLLSNYSITYVKGTLTVEEFKVTGIVSYLSDNSLDTPLADMVVKLLAADNTVLASATTNEFGSYELTGAIPWDVANVEVSTSHPWGGGNSTDALGIQLKTVGLTPLYWNPAAFIDIVADVNDEMGINATDALFVRRRAINQISSFPAGDWAFYAKDYTDLFFNNNAAGVASVDFAHITASELNIRTLCYGDINGSYNLNFVKSLKAIHSDEVQQVIPGTEFELPLVVEQDIEFGALTLFLKYQPEKVRIDGISSDIPGLEFNIEEGWVKVAWHSLTPEFRGSGDDLFTLVMTTIAEVDENDVIFEISNETEFADKSGKVIENYSLSISKIDNSLQNLVHCYPNPFNDKLNIAFTIAEAADVRITLVNSLGSVVTELLNGYMDAGHHNHVLNPGKYNLGKGLYFIRMQAAGENAVFNKLVRVVYVH
jgi:hypothetical protein